MSTLLQILLIIVITIKRSRKSPDCKDCYGQPKDALFYDRQTDRQTGRHDEANSRFSQFCERA